MSAKNTPVSSVLQGQSLSARFWDQVQKGDGCWLWTGRKEQFGYGIFSVGHRNCRAHRLTWEESNGPIPDSLFVLHDCDRNYPTGDITYRRCVRPDHLYLGTYTDNNRDTVSKGRCNPHPRRGWVKLSEGQIQEMRRLRAAGLGPRELAARFGVSRRYVQRVLAGKRCSRIPLPAPDLLPYPPLQGGRPRG